MRRCPEVAICFPKRNDGDVRQRVHLTDCASSVELSEGRAAGFEDYFIGLMNLEDQPVTAAEAFTKLER